MYLKIKERKKEHGVQGNQESVNLMTPLCHIKTVKKNKVGLHYTSKQMS